jgi:hypothetical protein
MTVKLWQLVAVVACATFVVGLGLGRYVVPNDPVNSAGAEFERHLNDAFTARRGDKEAQARIAERYGASTTPAGSSAAGEDIAAYDVRAAVPALEAYYAEHGTYAGASLAALQQQYDAGLTDVELVRVDAATYCLQSTAGGTPYHKAGPAANITPGTC